MITKKQFGTLACGKTAEVYTLENKNGMTASVCTYGGILTNLCVPDKNGKLRDVVLGYDTLEEYVQNDGYLSATVGRFANRLKKGQFTLNGKTYQITINNGNNTLHGGVDGFSFKVWDASVEGETLVLTYTSADGEEGYPGTVKVQVRFSLDEENALHIVYNAASDADTIVNLTNHAYFNLHGGEKPMLSHELWLNAEKYTRTDEELIPVGDVSVAGTEYDFRTARKVEKAIYDNNFVLGGGKDAQATVYEEESGIFMEMFTDLPCVQVYASCMLSDRKGKNGARYGLGSGLCLETQVSPNSPNRPECRDEPWLLPAGKTFTTETVYRFSVK